MSRWNDLDSGARDDVKEMLRDGVPVTNTDRVTITSDIQLDLDKFERFELYVDPSNGSNSNTGLTADDPLESIEAATYAIPAVGIINFAAPVVDLNLAAGETFQIDTQYFPFAWMPKISINGDAANPPTIEVAGGGSGIQVDYGHVEISDVDFTHQTGANPTRLFKLRYGAQVGLKACSIDGSAITSECVDLLYQSYFNFDGSTSISGPGDGTGVGIKAHSGSHVRADGSLDEWSYALWCDRAATADVIGGSIRNASFALRSEDGAAIKATDGVDFSGSATIGLSRNDAFIKLDPSNTYPGNTTINRDGGDVLAPDQLYYHSGGTITDGGGEPVSTAPQYQAPGDMAVTDGSGWDPDGDGFSEIVTWDGNSWQEIHDYGTAL